ncbi:peptide chain release factor N(5)-glutamine methyltransferase [Erythrobacter sp. CCH5-A1]|jgi:release factor glutamine methyltransferase|uniref:peptide chain release factor N(5)-glutamine methyltransferase n=1 Tax=Erythrobacter sp. CCH5-A1 TaxID=1768792 RepID=UPI000833793F|nr:peptide chain release factor N(5)-glutamine methyltransferase [Erythrobacter sp. CCH5-A1]
MTVGEAIRAAAEALAPTSDTARLDAELLMAHALGLTRSDMLLRAMRDPTPAGFAALVERRAAHEPVAYITGAAEFYGLTLKVTPATLIPRGDSETLIEAAREAFAGRPTPQRILDLGTGSGALLLAAMSIWREAEGVGVEREPLAAVVALQNAERTGINSLPNPAELAQQKGRLADLGVASTAFGYLGRARFRHADWRKRGWRKGLGTFDLILCNPPYVESTAALDRQVADYEPASALFAGPEGLDDYRVLIPQLRALMNEGALAVLEIGANQADAVGALANASGFATALRRDLAGRARALLLT